MKTDQELIELFATAGKYLPNTVKTYTQQIKYWQELLGDLHKATLQDIENVVISFKRNKPVRTIKLAVSALKTFYELTQDPIVNELALGKLGIFVDQTTKRYISPDRLEHIIIAEKPKYEKPLEVRDYTAFLTFVNTGAKLNEVCKLTFDDYHIDNEKPFIRFNVGEKNQRDVPIDNCFMVYLHCALPFWNEALVKHGVKPNYVFTSTHGEKPMHLRLMEYILSKYRVKPTEIRNTFLAKLKQKNLDSKSIARFLGISEHNAQRSYNFVDRYIK